MAVTVAGPNPGDQITRIANGPIIAPIGRCARFDRGWAAQLQGTLCAKGRRACFIIAEDVADQKRGLRLERRLRLGWAFQINGTLQGVANFQY